MFPMDLHDTHCLVDVHDIGIKLVVKHTFLHVEPACTTELCEAFCTTRRRRRALTEPCPVHVLVDGALDEISETCCESDNALADGTQSPTSDSSKDCASTDYDWIASTSDESSEMNSAIGTLESRCASPMSIASNDRSFDEASANLEMGKFLRNLNDKLVSPTRPRGFPSDVSMTESEGLRDDGRVHPQMTSSVVEASAPLAENTVEQKTPACAYVMLFGMPAQSSYVGPTMQPSIVSAHVPHDVLCGQSHPDASAMQLKCLSDTRTTLMLRNIPNDYSRSMLVDLLDSQGFVGRYDFVYLPIDYNRGAGFGYAFVNCVSPADAQQMKEQLQGFNQWLVGSLKICDVQWGEPLQGLEAHVDRYRNSSVMHQIVPDEYKPIVLFDGIRSPFPPPTKRIRLPRMTKAALMKK